MQAAAVLSACSWSMDCQHQITKLFQVVRVKKQQLMGLACWSPKVSTVFFAVPSCRMKLHHAWWSRKDAAVKVTIVTGLNPSRVNQLESQCNSYKGPISAAVYVVLHNPDANAPLTTEHKQQLAEAKDILDKFHKR